jgi:hypothetical protein
VRVKCGNDERGSVAFVSKNFSFPVGLRSLELDGGMSRVTGYEKIF